MVQRKTKRIRKVALSGIIFLFFLNNLLSQIPKGELSPPLEIHQLNIGQGDACFIKIDTLNIIIDAGPQGSGNSIIIPYLQSLGINKIHFTIATHHHADHIGGLDEVINFFQPAICYDRGETYNSTQFNEYIQSAGARRRTPAVAETLINVSTSQGKVFLICLALSGQIKNYGFAGTSDENTLSIALLLQFITNSLDTFKFFTAGDIYAKQESLLVSFNSELGGESPPFGKNTHLIKISHHGSRSSTPQILLDKMKPLAVFISCGDNNPYGHPHQETLTKLENSNSIRFIYQTTAGNRTSPKSIIAGHIITKIYDKFFTISTSNTPSRIDTFIFSKDNTVNIEPQPFLRENKNKEKKMTLKTTSNNGFTYLDIFIPNEMIQKVQLYNILGQLVHENEIFSYETFSLKIPNTASGVYLVLIKTNSKIYYEKIIITSR